MSNGTSIIEDALKRISVHSSFQAVDPKSITDTFIVLTSMIADWEDEGIKMGCVPLETVASELGEPLGARNAIVDNLAVLAAPLFPNAVVSEELKTQAVRGFRSIQRKWREVTIPSPVARSTYHKGQGGRNTYYRKGEAVADDG